MNLKLILRMCLISSKMHKYLQKLTKVKVWHRGRVRAPHKPLYLLLCFSRLQMGASRLHLFSEIEAQLAGALERFAPRVNRPHPEYPFWRLQSDELAVVDCPNHAALVTRQSNTDPTIASIRKAGCRGGLPYEDYVLLKNDKYLFNSAVHLLLDSHFPSTIHRDILECFDLDVSLEPFANQSVPSSVSDNLLRSYGNQCAISEFSLEYYSKNLGLDIAFICWSQYGGGIDPCNLIPMSPTVNRLFQLGVFTIDCSHCLEICSGVLDQHNSLKRIGLSPGRKMFLPENQELWPSENALKWHNKNVFRG